MAIKIAPPTGVMGPIKLKTNFSVASNTKAYIEQEKSMVPNKKPLKYLLFSSIILAAKPITTKAKP